jgi:hypothetical protein
VRIRKRPERRLKPHGAHGACERARFLTAIAVDDGNVRADTGILGHISLETVSNFNLEALGGDVLEQLLRLGVFLVDDRDDPQ